MPGALLQLTQNMPQQPVAGDTIIAPLTNEELKFST